MSGRRWCPSDWLDETCPVYVSDPSSSLRHNEVGTWCIVPDDSEDDPDRDTIPLEPNQVVAWQYTEPRGRFGVTKREDGSYAVEGGKVPADFTLCWLPGDPDTISESLDDLVQEYMEAGTETVEFYFWSDDISLRFEVDEGEGRLIEVAAL